MDYEPWVEPAIEAATRPGSDRRRALRLPTGW